MSEIADLYGYTPRPIDPDLGITQRHTEDGARVTMYKRMPGLYLSVRGAEVPDELARAAGFNVDRDREIAMTNFEVAAAEADIRARAQEVAREKRGGLSPAAQAKLPPLPDPVVTPPAADLGEDGFERDAAGKIRGSKDFYMKHIGGGRWNVLGRSGDVAYGEKLSEADAIEALGVIQKEFDSE